MARTAGREPGPPTGVSGRSPLRSALVAAHLAGARVRRPDLRELSDAQVLRLTGVLDHDGEPTPAGCYALGTRPQLRYPALTVIAVVQGAAEQPGRLRTLSRTELTGPLTMLLDGILDWCRDNLHRIHRYRPDGHMEVVPDLPLVALREFAGNALVHRALDRTTLREGRRIRLRLLREALLIENPGGPAGPPAGPVNPTLHRIAAGLRTADGMPFLDGSGGGVPAAQRALAEHGLPPARFIDDAGGRTVMMRRHHHDAPLLGDFGKPLAPLRRPAAGAPGAPMAPPASSRPTRHEPLVLAALATADGLTLAEVLARTGLNRQQVRYALRRPLAEGLVVMAGGRGRQDTRYRMAGEE